MSLANGCKVKVVAHGYAFDGWQGEVIKPVPNITNWYLVEILKPTLAICCGKTFAFMASELQVLEAEDDSSAPA